MKLEELPFKIGMQYENWEFDLELERVERSYEVYRYFKKDIKNLDGKNIQEILLYFELDILFKVEIILKENQVIIIE
ncbi:hypothetical protein [Tenacibaculum maritimum]|uniref:hypothetical protein n=1 Tax=Tenacibaculum maritimum TaxID=107401 RepID=UPI001E6327E9|nr:hypothetical protein [Tenacibaculum maritimum]MCD9584765.1 hypothetical protein [Tenacibaculum maritimum]MCD9621621.1 hypothetical protein [Tenacibaculum maritimum]MCD9626812.1 hypothetical protein [Tenacibaculum maritimum]MCD9630490.1 hypothetical protein [Tenacibaculum maritimum]MCD9633758.1 hypothetical protein [Tenacibaculum maritimum]